MKPPACPQSQFALGHTHSRTHIHAPLLMGATTPQQTCSLYVEGAVSRGHCSSMGDTFNNIHFHPPHKVCARAHVSSEAAD